MVILLTERASAAVDALAKGPMKDETRLRKVGKTLRLLEADPHHPGLKSHRFRSLDGVWGEAIWESPFARVSLKFNVEVFDLALTKCNNPGSETVAFLTDAVFKFATTAWHIGCRGVI